MERPSHMLMRVACGIHRGPPKSSNRGFVIYTSMYILLRSCLTSEFLDRFKVFDLYLRVLFCYLWILVYLLVSGTYI